MLSTVAARTAAAHRWFRAFRRTRPFWGGVWLVAGGWTVLRFSLSSVQLIAAPASERWRAISPAAG